MNNYLSSVAKLCEYPGRRAALWRNRGETLGTAHGIGFLLPYLPRENEEVAFLIATLMAGDRNTLAHFAKHQTLPEHLPVSLGATLDVAESVSNAEANTMKRTANPDPKRPESPYERRLRRLLDARLDTDGTGEMPFLLRQAVQQICTPDAPPRLHWPNLYHDLCQWNVLNKPVQKRWARDFYGATLAVVDISNEINQEKETIDHAD